MQTVLTTYYEDIMGVQGASGCPRTKVVKRKFEDHENTGLAPDTTNENAAAAAEEEPHTPTSPAPSPVGKGRRTGGGSKKSSKA